MIKTNEENGILYAIIDKDINNNIEDISELVDLQYDFINGNYEILVFQFNDCQIIDAAVAVIIGTLPIYAALQKKRVRYRFKDESNDHPIFVFMKEVGMYEYFSKHRGNDEINYAGENAIPFNKIKDEGMMEEYTDKIMELAPIKMEREARCILSSYIYEVYQNGFFHSGSEIGVFTSGIWKPERKEFVFSIYDMGIGITNKIREHFGMTDISSEQCLKIAFVEGFTTWTDDSVNRGLGLSRLEKFIRLNEGKMYLFTDDICCMIKKQEEKNYIKLEKPIKGTLFIINIIADENHIYVVE